MTDRNIIRPALMKYFAEHVGVDVYLADLQNIFPTLSRKQIQSGVNNLRQLEDQFPIQTIVQGNVWRHRPNGAPLNYVPTQASKPIFEMIGKTKDGAYVIQSEDGTLFKAVELV